VISSDIARQKRERLGDMRANRDIPHDLVEERQRLKKETSAFQRNGDVVVQVWNDTTCVNKYDP
jgi:hypothetical protein